VPGNVHPVKLGTMVMLTSDTTGRCYIWPASKELAIPSDHALQVTRTSRVATPQEELRFLGALVASVWVACDDGSKDSEMEDKPALTYEIPDRILFEEEDCILEFGISENGPGEDSFLSGEYPGSGIEVVATSPIALSSTSATVALGFSWSACPNFNDNNE
jgi:hypothetical protein